MPAQPIVSVIIPTRNRRAYLQEAIHSVHEQAYEHWEAIVIDDASEDDTWDWLQSLPEDRFRCLQMDQNRGSTITRNAGLRLARGDYCLFLDDDDRLPPDSLATHLAALEDHSSAIATLGAVARIDADGAPAPGLLRPTPTNKMRRGIWRDVMFWWVFLVGASMFRKSALDSTGGFDESIVFYGDDVDFWLRLGHLGDVVLISDTVLEWRSHDQTRPDDYLEILEDLRRRHCEACAAQRRATAKRILAASTALSDLRVQSGEPGNLLRVGKLLTRVARCPYLVSSPLSRREIGGAIKRDLTMDPWLRPLRRAASRD